jgi:hypothetical protein
MNDNQGSPVAHDDDGQPITEQDLVTESYQKPLQGSTASLLPPFDFDGTEEDWEQQQLIEAVRARRRAAKA